MKKPVNTFTSRNAYRALLLKSNGITKATYLLMLYKYKLSKKIKISGFYGAL